MSKPYLIYPESIAVEPALPTKGRYSKGYPEGAVVHFTAGAYGLSELALARQLGFTYFLIDESGGVHQGFPLDRWGSHAGESEWKPLGIPSKSVSKRLVGIEVDCAGHLEADGHGNFKTWWGKLIEHENVRVVVDEENRKAGAYHVFTEAQEAALTKLILWLKANNPDVFNLDFVVGHDEVSPGRKVDPGGSLSMTMPSYRSYLSSLWKASASRPETEERAPRSPVA